MSGKAWDEDWCQELSNIRVRYNKLLIPDPVLVDQNIISFGFNYTSLKETNFDEILDRLSNLVYTVTTNTVVPVAGVELWKRKLEQLNAHLQLLKKVKQCLYNSDRGSLFYIQDEMNEVMYAPNKDFFDLTLAELKKRFSQKDKLNRLKPFDFFDYINLLPPYEELLRKHPYVSFPERPLDDNFLITMEELKKLFEKELKKLSLDNNWKVLIDKTHKYDHVQVFYRTKTILIPSARNILDPQIPNTITHKKYLRLVAHEIQTHVQRSASGFGSKLKLLSVGLDSYLLAEEGLATFREQQAVGTTHQYYAGFESYLAISLALGIDRDNKKRSPVELFEILTSIYKDLYSKNFLQAQHSALKKIKRIYICRPGQTSYLINTRDLCYRMGNMQMHDIFSRESIQDNQLNIGMYDPGNKRHVDALRALSLL